MIWQSQQKDFSVFPGLFHSGAGAGDTAGMHLPVYKMNFPRKNPMKMAAMTTRREGREAVLASRPRRLVEFDVMWSERGTFLILTPSSCNRERNRETVNTWVQYSSLLDQIHHSNKWVKNLTFSDQIHSTLFAPIYTDSNTIHPIKF